jgi:hypothetical protein
VETLVAQGGLVVLVGRLVEEEVEVEEEQPLVAWVAWVVPG